ncbi:MAG: STAS domain-containing protein [Phycisphaerae bacterium]
MQSDRLPHPPVNDTPFTIDVERRENAAVVYVTGSCTMEVSEKLGACIKGLASEALNPIILELSALDFIESSGLGGIVAGYLRARRYHGEIRLVAPSMPILNLLELTRLTQLFGVYSSIDEALSM